MAATLDEPRRALRAECADCVGLCCVALAFAKSADFGFDKAAGEECVNLDDGYRCRIHPQLRESGFKGCTVFDCFGAGQHVTQHTFEGASWRDDDGARAGMFAVFPVVRQLHELLWYLEEALRMPAALPLHPALRAARDDVEAAADAPAEAIRLLDVDVRLKDLQPRTEFPDFSHDIADGCLPFCVAGSMGTGDQDGAVHGS